MNRHLPQLQPQQVPISPTNVEGELPTTEDEAMEEEREERLLVLKCIVSNLPTALEGNHHVLVFLLVVTFTLLLFPNFSTKPLSAIL